MKIVGWMMFGTTFILFVVTFCRQQFENELMDRSTVYAQPSPQWMQFEHGQWDEAASEISSTTQPSDTAAIAAGDIADAVK